ncbi:MAG: putative DNA binding domain-containing protein [Dysgonamonadaceae bacterium]|jgi:ATP-dependent DNA helicase RecG|nr:putative DNA binding domain-containing protein [Dysgonamonadaceae bacterium]
MYKENFQDLLAELTALPSETEWVEFKMNKGSVTDEQIGEYISAMSNGATVHNKPFGYLVWGVEDGTHAVKGTNFRFSQAKHGGNEELELFLRRYLHPKINFEKFEFESDGSNIVLLRIPAAKNEPTNFQKKPYIRIGGNKTDLRNFPELMRIIYNSQEDWSAKIIENATLNDLDKEAIAVARIKYKELNSNKAFYEQIDKWDDLQFLDKSKITINGKITHTAILLLGKEESTHYLLPSVAEITWKLDTEEKAYEHFATPFLLTTTKVMQRIRNLKYKFFPDNELLATTVDKYDTRSILEALHNCIAHQDYNLNSRILLTEQVDKLMFTNAGNFYEGNPDDYAFGTKTPEKYRNQWLATAMVNLGMIDRLGYGIHSLCLSQRKRFFPMPDYDLSQQSKVSLTIYGQAIDENYSKILIQRSDLALQDVINLDRVQKKRPITDFAATELRKQKLIEGRKPNYFVGIKVAQITDKKAEYSKNTAFNKQQYFDWILKSIKEHGSLSRKDINELLWKMLPQWMDDKQKKIKINHLISELRDGGLIKNAGSYKNSEWVLVKS